MTLMLVKHILKYLVNNLDLKLVYKRDDDLEIKGYADASYANESAYNSRSGYGFLLGNSLISWNSQKQSIIAQSAAEAEYYAAVSAANEGLWLKHLMKDLGYEQDTLKIF